MDSIRRTVPRSARRTTRSSGVTNTTAAPISSNTTTLATTNDPTSTNTQQHQPRYIPGFSPSVRKQSNQVGIPPSQDRFQQLQPHQPQQQVKQQQQPLSGEPQETLSSISYCASPQTCVRWLPATPGARQALALSGSYDELSLFAVWTDNNPTNATTSLNHSLLDSVSHTDGRVTCLDVPYDSAESLCVGVGSSTGCVQLFRPKDDVDNWELINVGKLMKTTTKEQQIESVIGVASLPSNNKVVAGGENGTLCVYSTETNQIEWGERFDQVGLHALAPVNEVGSQVAGASVTGHITIWDVRSGTVCQRLSNRGGLGYTAAAMCVTVDSSQPHFILGGFSNGEICGWDRRGGLNDDVVSRATVHDGMVWDVRVVGGNRAGRLVTCGEDGLVLLLDYAMAGARGMGRGGNGDMSMGESDGSVSGEVWRATLDSGDVRSLVGRRDQALAVNGVDAHANAELFAYATESAQVGFGMLA